jgi:hypothetical protein
VKWYPFETCWLKASQNREALHEIILEQTFLSDAGYRNTDNKKRFFFGSVNEREFELESIDKERKLTPFIAGEVLGVENETYIRLRFGAFKHKRIYALLILFTLCGMALFIQGTLKIHSSESQIYLTSMGSVLMFLAAYMGYLSISFSKKLKYSIDFFRGLYDAEIVEENEVPKVFLL